MPDARSEWTARLRLTRSQFASWRLRNERRFVALHWRVGLSRPPLHKLTQAVLHRSSRLEADLPLRLLDVGEPPPHRCRLTGRPILGRQVHAHDATERTCQLDQAGFG